MFVFTSSTTTRVSEGMTVDIYTLVLRKWQHNLHGANFFTWGWSQVLTDYPIFYTNDIGKKRVFQCEKLVDYFNLINEAKIVQIFLYVTSYSSQTELTKIAKFFFVPLPNIFFFLTIMGSVFIIQGTKRTFKMPLIP